MLTMLSTEHGLDEAHNDISADVSKPLFALFHDSHLGIFLVLAAHSFPVSKNVPHMLDHPLARLSNDFPSSCFIDCVAILK